MQSEETMPEVKIDPDRYYRPGDLEQMGLAAKSTLARWRCEGTGPEFIRLGNGSGARIVYAGRAIQDWLGQRSFPSTTAADARRSPGTARPKGDRPNGE